jgi:hypothetical protein
MILPADLAATRASLIIEAELVGDFLADPGSGGLAASTVHSIKDGQHQLAL